MFGFQRRLFRLCENVTDFPNQGFLPQISQTADMRSRVTEGLSSPRARAEPWIRGGGDVAAEVRPVVRAW